MDIVEYLKQIGDFIRANPISLSQVPQKDEILAILIPSERDWNDIQKDWIPKWFLKTTQEKIDELNIKQGEGLKISGLEDINGYKYLPSYLIINNNVEQNYPNIREDLEQLPLYFVEDIQWKQNDL